MQQFTKDGTTCSEEKRHNKNINKPRKAFYLKRFDYTADTQMRNA